MALNIQRITNTFILDFQAPNVRDKFLLFINSQLIIAMGTDKRSIRKITTECLPHLSNVMLLKLAEDLIVTVGFTEACKILL